MCWYIGHRPKLWVRRSPQKAMAGTIPCSRPATSIEPFTIEYCENNQKVITTANQRKEKYHKEPMETENKADCLKRGKTLVTRSWLV